MIRVVNGNILEANEDIIAHQVNCMGVMGAGLAKQVKYKYPNVFDKYIIYCNAFGDRGVLMGQCLMIETEDKYIANLFGQYKFGTREKQTDYSALESSLKKLKYIAQEHSKTVAIPYNLGCGLAGGDWSIVYQIIDNVFKDYDVTLYRL